MISIEDHIKYSGILLKRARWTLLRRWQKRLFKLTSNELQYYKLNNESRPKCCIDRSLIVSVISNEQTQSIYEFLIILTNRTIRCKAPTIEAKKFWIYYLQPNLRYFKRYPVSYITNSVHLNKFVYSLKGPLPFIKILERQRYRELHYSMRRFHRAVINIKSYINLRQHFESLTQFIQYQKAAEVLHDLVISKQKLKLWDEFKISKSELSTQESEDLTFPYLRKLFLRLNCMIEKCKTRQVWKSMILRKL